MLVNFWMMKMNLWSKELTKQNGEGWNPIYKALGIGDDTDLWWLEWEGWWYWKTERLN